MKESSTDKASYIERVRNWARGFAYGGSQNPNATDNTSTSSVNEVQHPDKVRDVSNNDADVDSGVANAEAPRESASPAPQVEGEGAVVGEEGANKKPNVVIETYLELKKVLLHSWINLFLVCVPVGIALANIPNRNAGATFGVNAVAIIPLAALLSHATESVARRMGDTVGALLNVTFGNAVELIIFIALVKGEIRIVQSSLLGSILANLLLILGMAFVCGGLRYQEQIYNSTVTNMSTCLLSLSVISLMLPTAFHASFADKDEADRESLKISHGVSVILLLVYIVYLLFQLKSHAYMYESTPQDVIDEEATPGPVASYFNGDSSSDSSSDSDSNNSGHSRETLSRRVRRVIRGHRRRRSSVASADTEDVSRTHTSSLGTNGASPVQEDPRSGDSTNGQGSVPRMDSQGSEEIAEEDHRRAHHRRHRNSRRTTHTRTNTARADAEETAQSENVEEAAQSENVVAPGPNTTRNADQGNGEPRRVDFAEPVPDAEGTPEGAQGGTRRPFSNLRGLSLRPVAKSLAPPVFSQRQDGGDVPQVPAGPVPRVRYGIRRTNSLHERPNRYQFRPPGAMMPSQVHASALARSSAENDEGQKDDLSRGAAVIMLLISTALVAVCAEFMVDAIDDVVANSALKETFIGLIILPIVGNAAEHVTAVTVALKNKVDLAIGVAVGSSIQIALFITPLVVIIGWAIDQPMTLYFTLFETVCLFVSAFIINFLILDGRSNYLEGALLCATYVIIAVVAFFYPEGAAAGALGT
ncbi:calcium/proton exchanger [Hypoxylon sp. NC1633]|nr:calcium/proton exchanger [Hypoxylon sp. NC1633]